MKNININNPIMWYGQPTNIYNIIDDDGYYELSGDTTNTGLYKLVTVCPAKYGDTWVMSVVYSREYPAAYIGQPSMFVRTIADFMKTFKKAYL